MSELKPNSKGLASCEIEGTPMMSVYYLYQYCLWWR